MTTTVKPLVLPLAILSIVACQPITDGGFCSEESKKVGAVYVSQSTASVKVGDSVVVTGFAHNPEGFNGLCTPYPSWTSSDTTIATVRLGGIPIIEPQVFVRGRKAGQTNIIAKAGNFADTVIVTVLQ